MEITTAASIIKTAITNATNNLQALQIASDLLNNTYSAQFTALENAQKEANDLSLELNEKTKECATLSDSLTTANVSISDLQNIVVEKSKNIDDLVSQVGTLQSDKEALANNLAIAISKINTEPANEKQPADVVPDIAPVEEVIPA